MQYIVKQQISNHPLFPNIKRNVIIEEMAIQPKYKQIRIDAFKQFLNSEDEDISKEFSTEIKDWIITNNDTTIVRDEQGRPIFDPNYNINKIEGPDNHKYLKAPSFDYFFSILTDENAPSPIKLLKSHIFFNDQIGFFDQ